VECLDSSRGVKFTQTFRNNKTVAEDPIVKACSAKEKKGGDYTRITFCPDLARFKMESLDRDAVALLSKRAYDIAGSMASRHGRKLSVTLNGEKVPVKDFKSYLQLYDGVEKPVAYAKVDERWEVGVAPSDGSFQQVSFVNAICTSKGGEHVQYIADQVAKNLKDVVKKKNKGTEVKPNQIKNQLCVFVNALIDNPSFDSQTKEFLTTKKKVFGSKCDLDKKFMKAIEKSEVVENCLAFAKFQDRKAMKRVGGTKKAKVTGISKLDDANFAGGPKAKDCTLIITEGDSAKSLAMSGLSVVGRDYYGVFPLKGKPLNVRDAKTSQVLNNEEIKNISKLFCVLPLIGMFPIYQYPSPNASLYPLRPTTVEIMGLKPGEEYDETTVKKLRYGHLMIMADQDHDGSHIKGLVINFLHHFWPSLLNVPGFLQQFITPIIKASKGKKSKTFFTLPEYEAWKESTGNDAKGWKIKYYKGLGTSTSAEAKEYFGNLDMHEVHFGMLEDDVDVEIIDNEEDDEEDGIDMMEFEGSKQTDSKPTKRTSGGELIEMAFSKSKVEDRKVWLGTFQKDTYLNYAEAQKEGVRFSDFINKELILFSNADNGRSIPHVLDGFKPSQRKILFACFKRKLKGEIKVAQLAGYVSEHSAYHHGEASLQGAIVGMAQTFVGSNNINLLTPSGQFGTRRMGGKDSASPRYIFTKLEKITRAIFHPDDDALLTYLNDDGLSIEPENYMPVIPMVLVNGSDGIGTGWSSSTPNYCPRQVIANLRRRLKGEELEKMSPHYSGFAGEMIAETGNREGSFIVRGKIERVDDTTLKITELPIKKWTQDYKMFLEGLMLGDVSSKSAAAAKKGKKGDDDEDDADGGKKKVKTAITIQDFKENHTDATVSFTITATKEAIDSYEKEKDGLVGKFKLKTTISTSNMQLFNEQGRIIKYDTPEDILEEFYRVRLDFYEKRKAHLLEILRKERLMLSNKARFVEEVCSGDLVVSNRKRSELLDELQERGYDLMTKDDEKKSNDNADGSDDEDEDEAEDSTSYSDLAKGYEYLLGMKIWTLTFEKSQKLRVELEEKTQEVADLEATQPSTIWWHDLDAIEDALDERDEEMAAAAAEEMRQQAKNKKTQAKKASKKTKGKGRKKKADEWDSDMEDSEEEEDIYSDSDEEFASKKKRARAKGGVKSASRKDREAPPAFAAPPNARFSPKKAESKKAASTAKKVAASAKPAAATKKVVASKKVESKPAPVSEPVHDNNGFESDDSDESSVGLAAKLKGKLMVSPPPKSIKVDTASDIDSDDDDVIEDFASSGSAASKKRPSPKNESTPSTKEKNAKKPKKATAAAKKPTAATKKKPAAKKTAPVKKMSTSVCDLSDSEMSFACDDGHSSGADDSAAEDEVVEVAPRARSRRANVVRKTYTFSDSEEEESEFSFDD
jgi:DNA topoisomerase-2